jgi:tetratricopeptide (TPR) repeat protein
MHICRFGLISLLMGVSAAPAIAADRCQLESFAELPVTMEGLRPIVVAKINGVDARFVADSGSFYSILSAAAAAEFQLRTRPVRETTGSRLAYGSEFSVRGVGGSSAELKVTTVQTLTLAQYTIPRVDFLVGGTDMGGGLLAGVLGQNLIRIDDVEYDLAHGVMRLIKPVKCGSRSLAYWATPSQPVGVVELDSTTLLNPQPVGSASVNGIRIRVGFDTGSPVSMLSLPAAKRAGITPDTPGVQPAGTMFGFGSKVINIWAAPITSFEIGGEEIKNTRLLIGDLRLGAMDMLVGDDFFLAHRVYVAYGQRKLYFTYNGGAVFKLGSTPLTQSAQSQSQPPGATNDSSAGTAGSAPANPVATASASSAPADTLGHFADQPTEAAEFLRRGTAYAARRDFDDALADLKRACELAPREPDYLYELGRVQWQSGHPDLALQSFDRVLALKPDHIPALFGRAQLNLREPARAKEDLDAVDRLVPPQDNVRLQLASLYGAAYEFAAAVRQYDLWISSHREDARLATALNGRCWVQAEANQNLDRALSDCNQALRLIRGNPQFLDSRGLVQLRRGKLDRAIDDYDAALALRPKVATSLYGRGLAELLKGRQAEGKADLAAASAIEPRIAERFARMGLMP